MTAFIATFFTHYDAIVFNRGLDSLGIPGQMMPVPRKLSSSCGTCISFSAKPEQLSQLDTTELERLVEVAENGYLEVIDNR